MTALPVTAQGIPAAVLFDWNGTLIDDMERARRASSLVRQQWSALGELTPEEFRQAWCLPLSDHARRLGVPEDHLDAAVRAWSTHLSALDAPLSDGASATLGALRSASVAIAVVSAASDYAVRRDLRAHGLEQGFDGIHCGVADKQAVTRRYVRHTGVGAVWYVGDTKMDMLQARAAGAVAIGYTCGYNTAGELRDAGAHCLIDRLDELLDLISGTRPKHG